MITTGTTKKYAEKLICGGLLLILASTSVLIAESSYYEVSDMPYELSSGAAGLKATSDVIVSASRILYRDPQSSGANYYMSLLRSDDVTVRSLAVKMLSNIASNSNETLKTEIIDSLLAHLPKETEKQIVDRTLEIVKSHGSRQDGSLASASVILSNPSSYKFEEVDSALQDLIFYGDVRAIPSLRFFLNHASSCQMDSLKVSALRSLIAIGGSESALVVEEALENEYDIKTAVQMIKSLGIIGQYFSVAVLDEILKKAQISEIRVEAVNALASIGGPEAEKSILWALDSSSNEVNRAASRIISNNIN